MAEHARDAPMVVVDATQPHEGWIFRAIDKTENVMYIIGGDSLVNARRQAHALLRDGFLVEDPIRKEHRTWKI
jgi:hypothetical protein